MYATEQRIDSDHSVTLAVYMVHSDTENIELIDSIELGLIKGLLLWSVSPRVEHPSQRVFIPCGFRGVTVARLDGDRLLKERTLICVRHAVSVDILSSDTVYVCDLACLCC